MELSPSICENDLKDFRRNFEENKVSALAAKAVSKSSIHDVCYDSTHARRMNEKFSLEIPTMTACNQKSSGRCWIFAALNILREKMAKELNLPEFELSQSYFSFYDHLEKANTFLQHILETAALPLADRYVSQLLQEPVGDGGWWEYFVGLCCKYGAVPKEAMPETYQSSNTDTMNMLINMQLRKDACSLRKAVSENQSPEALQALKKEMLLRIYNLLAICLGTPPDTFDFEYVDKDKAYHVCRGLTPLRFYKQFIGRDLQNIVSLMNAPTAEVPYYQTCYTKGEESIYGAFHSKRLNVPMEDLKSAVIRQLQAGEPVWFVCDCDYFGSRKEGIWDTGLYDYEALFSLDFGMPKQELLEYRQCSLNHAMLLTGVNLTDGRPDKWKIENSWGTENGKNGYFTASDAWFDRYVFTASIDMLYLTEQQKEQFRQEPIVLEPWSILG